MFLIVTKNGYGKRTPLKSTVFKAEAVKVLKHAMLLKKMATLVSVRAVTGEEDLNVDYHWRSSYPYRCQLVFPQWDGTLKV